MDAQPGGLGAQHRLGLDPLIVTETFFAQNWYRVAALRPRLAAHVVVERHRYGGQPWYVLLDRLSGRVHRMSPASFLFAVRLDGVRTVDDVWQQTAAELDDDAPGQPAVLQILMQLHAADLLSGDMPPDAAELLSRRDRMGRQLLTRNLRSPMSIQVPLFDPDRFLSGTLRVVQPLLGPVGGVLWLLLVVAGAVTAGQHWDELTGNLLDRLLGTQGLLAMALCYPVLKILHELGHGWMAKRFGCEVREMGVMLLVMIPVPYVDASASAALRNKWQRAAVAFAGIAVELGLAAAATLVWAAAEPGLLRAVAFNVMVIGSLSTLVVNGNPLLRFDGYYVLSDVLEVPNLAQRGSQFWGYVLNRFVLGVPNLRPSSATMRERFIFALYTPAALAYRLSVSAGIALYVATHYFILGVALAVVMLATTVAWPVLRTIGRIVASPLYARCRARATGLTFAGIAAVVLPLALVPAPLHSTGDGVVWLPREAFVRAGADGFVQSVTAAGAQVPAGALLVALAYPLADARLEVERARVDELRAKYETEWVTDRIAAAVTGFELSQQEAVLNREQQRQARMTVTAGTSGAFSPIRPTGDLEGRFVKEGEVLGYVVPPGGELVRVLVPQVDIALMQERLVRVSILLPDSRTTVASSVLRAVPGGDSDLPSEALATSNGGSIVTDPRDTKTMRAFERHFQFDLSLPATAAVRAAGLGSKVLVRFDYAWEPVASMVYRRVRQGLLGRFNT